MKNLAKNNCENMNILLNLKDKLTNWTSSTQHEIVLTVFSCKAKEINEKEEREGRK